MDPLSHAIIGLSTFSIFQPAALTNPACIGAIIGSVAPDFDIITRIKGDYVYLRHHRVESHSVPGAMAISLIIALLLSVFYSQSAFYQTFFWTMMGTLSHILMDLFNSYGVAILYPINKRKYTLNLLMIYDPVILSLCIYIVFLNKRRMTEYILLLMIFMGYLSIKAFEKYRLKESLHRHFGEDYNIEDINVMPSTLNPFKWDYIVNTSCHYIVGEIGSIKGKINLFRSLKKVWDPIIEKTLSEELGIYFSSFSPIFHIDVISKDKLIIKLTDLRYRLKDEFMHFAFFYYNDDFELIFSEFQPFGLDKRIKIKAKNRKRISAKIVS